MNCSEEFEKKMKGSKTKLIIAGVIIAIAALNEIGFYSIMQKAKSDAVDLIDVEEEGKYACVEVHGMSNYFSTRSNDEKAYFVSDNDYLYIASIGKDALEDLNEFKDFDYEGDDRPEPVTICGKTQNIDSSLKNVAMDAYNELLGEKLVSSANFSDYFGSYYLNTDLGPENDFLISSMAMGVVLFVGVIFLLLYFRDISKTKKTLKKYANEIDKIKMDIASPETIYEKKAKVFLTKDYLINVANGMEIYDYKDIIWVYPHELRQNGYTTQRSIYIVTKDTKAHLIANISTSKKNNVMFDEIYESLLLRVPDALHGYTKENKDKVKELSKKK